ncbi:MAG: SusD/RagB family nutrient-binding outer membrane lipoprotein [Chitinophagaceae bacterium]|nr:SusD/RagB family nutrient-binding outer membrane lipoprotein [Chitinophagaceae bacterium]
MKKIITYTGLLLIMGACTKNISRFNNETKNSTDVAAETLFSNATRNLVDGLTTPNVNDNVFRFTVQHWAMSTYQDEVQYDFSTRLIPERWWARMYRDVLADLNEAKRLVTAAGPETTTKTNQLAMIDIMEVYAFQILVNTFGDIPYTEALDVKKLFPKYDDAKTVYYDLLARLAADISKLNVAGGGFSPVQDLIAGGNVNKWIKFANSLQVRMAMTIADEDNAKAKTLFEAAESKAISSSSEDIVFKYFGASPNTNPIWVDIVQSGRLDYVSAKPLVDVLKNTSDPRLSLYYQPNSTGEYVGGIVGGVNGFAGVAKPSAKVSAPDFPAILADYAEMEFYRAEAKERGYTVAGTAEQHYNNAITASILSWGGSAANAATYLASPDVAYSTAAGTWRQKIGTQKWIALYNRPFEGWTELRRLDFPVLNLPLGAKSGFPNRFIYPGIEQQLNGTNYKAAAAKIGGDKVETKLFWDKF